MKNEIYHKDDITDIYAPIRISITGIIWSGCGAIVENKIGKIDGIPNINTPVIIGITGEVA